MDVHGLPLKVAIKMRELIDPTITRDLEAVGMMRISTPPIVMFSEFFVADPV